MNKINAILDKLIYKGDKENPDTFRKGRFFIVSMFLFSILSISYIPYYLADSVETVPYVKPLFYLSLVALALVFVIYPRYGYRNLIFLMFCIPSAISSFSSVYYSTGGVYSSDIAMSVVMTLFIFLVTNKTIGICVSVIHIIIYSCFYYAEINGFRDFKGDALTLGPEYYLTMAIVSFVFATLMILLHENSKDKYLSELKKSKIEIEIQKAEIISSITYAKKIQQAKLRSKEEIYSTLQNSFILFKPKDIVSGDFYFFYTHKNLVFIAAADCTGHGVPGAIMSILCSEKLEDAVSRTTDTSEILSLVNRSVKASLQQSGNYESAKDGMDIALCCIDTTILTVKFAGANRPFWLIRKDNNVVEEIKGTKKAIGGFTEDAQLFESHELKLHQGDTFYLFTDGYADTFSGKDNKKLTTKRFRELVLTMKDKTIKEQEQQLDNFIENWKTGTEQIDDILVIGIRL